MAWSRLEKVGTIFSRVNGLIRAGALKEEDKPLWYDLYKRFPPIDEPKYDRPAKDVAIRKIFYPEDIVRARFHKLYGYHVRENLADHRSRTKCQRFLEKYYSLKEQGSFGEEELFDKTAELLGLKGVREVEKMAVSDKGAEGDLVGGAQGEETIASSFRKARERQGESPTSRDVNIRDIFKE